MNTRIAKPATEQWKSKYKNVPKRQSAIHLWLSDQQLIFNLTQQFLWNNFVSFALCLRDDANISIFFYKSKNCSKWILIEIVVLCEDLCMLEKVFDPRLVRFYGNKTLSIYPERKSNRRPFSGFGVYFQCQLHTSFLRAFFFLPMFNVTKSFFPRKMSPKI
jgi:hypothetical protein